MFSVAAAIVVWLVLAAGLGLATGWLLWGWWAQRPPVDLPTDEELQRLRGDLALAREEAADLRALLGERAGEVGDCGDPGEAGRPGRDAVHPAAEAATGDGEPGGTTTTPPMALIPPDPTASPEPVVRTRRARAPQLRPPALPQDVTDTDADADWGSVAGFLLATSLPVEGGAEAGPEPDDQT